MSPDFCLLSERNYHKTSLIRRMHFHVMLSGSLVYAAPTDLPDREY
jgi:hypothetical protein